VTSTILLQTNITAVPAYHIHVKDLRLYITQPIQLDEVNYVLKQTETKTDGGPDNVSAH